MLRSIDYQANQDVFLYCLRKSKEELQVTIESSDVKKIEVEYRLRNFVHALINFWERTEKKSSVNKNDKRLFSAFKHANNRIKHEISLLDMHKVEGGVEFPIQFPLMVLPLTFNWIVDDLPIKPKFENQLKRYKELLQGKELLSSVDEVITIIEKYI
jgi:hypothetical protein